MTMHPFRIALLGGIMLAFALPAGVASAADCTSGTTAWTNPGGGRWANAENWSNGVPSSACDAVITLAGEYGIDVGRGTCSFGVARSLTIGGTSGKQTLNIVGTGTCPGAERADYAVYIGAGGVTVNRYGAVNMTSGVLSTDGALRLAGGSLRGTGALGAVHGVHNQGGRLQITAPGERNDGWSGIIAIDGDYSQDARATLDLAADFESHVGSILRVSGKATLGGTLRAALPTPMRGNGRIVSADSRAGRFASATITGQHWHVRYDREGAILVPDAKNPLVLSRPRLSSANGGRSRLLTVGANATAKLVVAFARRQVGHMVAGVCHFGPPQSSGQARCVRSTVVLRLHGSLHRGKNHFEFGVGGLRPGHYRLTLVATDRSGNHSLPVRVSLAVPAT